MRYQVITPLTPREALEQALADFGSNGLGLQLMSQTNLSLVFQGGGGHIAVTAEPGATTTLEIETREWDYGVQQFMARVQRRRPWWQRWWRRKTPDSSRAGRSPSSAARRPARVLEETRSPEATHASVCFSRDPLADRGERPGRSMEGRAPAPTRHAHGEMPH
jgi:hypothetical protein